MRPSVPLAAMTMAATMALAMPVALAAGSARGSTATAAAMSSSAVSSDVMSSGVVAGRTVPATAAAGALAVEGFQSESDPVARIDASAPALSLVGVDGVTLATSGARVHRPDAVARAQLARAHRDHRPAELLVSNFDDGINDFSEPVAWRLLHSAAHRRLVAATLASVVQEQGWDGVNLDLESLQPRDRPGLVSLLRQVRTDLPHDRTLSIDLMAATHPSGYAALGYDVPAIAATVDRIVVMTYDQHGPWENTPGPVGSLRWAQRCLSALLAAGAPRGKVDLGIAGYGYAWRPHSNDQLSDAQAVALVRSQHAQARWDAAAAEWTATLPDGSTLWWSDTRSYRARYAAAAAAHLHGVAVWSLGLSDPIPTQ